MIWEKRAVGVDIAERLAEDRALLGRTSTAQRVADILRERITEGFFAPGARLSEDSICEALGVSRNTLREAFRILTHERLLVHELNRGVFVRQLPVDDVIDLFRLRKVVECTVIRSVNHPLPGVQKVAAAVDEGEAAAADQDWQRLGTANIHFHQALAALAGSPRIDDLMRGMLAELRLVFHVMADPRRFHERYLPTNRQIVTRLEVGDGTGAEALLARYLDDAEHQLVDAYTERFSY